MRGNLFPDVKVVHFEGVRLVIVYDVIEIRAQRGITSVLRVLSHINEPSDAAGLVCARIL